MELPKKVDVIDGAIQSRLPSIFPYFPWYVRHDFTAAAVLCLQLKIASVLVKSQYK